MPPRCSTSLGHTVESAYPAPLDDLALLVHFTTVLAASTAYDLRKLATIVGRALTADDVEPVTWAQAELGRAVTADAYLEAVESLRAWSRRMAEWWQPPDGRRPLEGRVRPAAHADDGQSARAARRDPRRRRRRRASSRRRRTPRSPSRST